MQIKIKKQILEAIEVFKTYDEFVKYILQLDKNLRNETETAFNFINNLYQKLLTNNGVVSYSLLKHWLKENYKFNTSKYGVKEYFIERGWNEENATSEINKRLVNIKKRNKLCIEYWLLKGLSEYEAKVKIFEIQSSASKQVKNRSILSKVNLINKGMNKEDADRFMQKKSQFSKEFWIDRGLTEDNAMKKISRLQSINSDKLSQKRKELPNKYSATTQTQLGYWIKNGYSDEEAKLKLKERQSTFTLDKCIKKYGYKIGETVYNLRQTKWREKLVDNGSLASGYSKISQELFNNIILEYQCDINKIYYATHNKEYYLRLKNYDFYQYDFVDLNKKRIIEYNGDLYHANPSYYLSEDCPNPFRKELTAKDIWERDTKKLEAAKSRGFDVLVIWDSEYKKNKEEIINKCIEFLNKN